MKYLTALALLSAASFSQALPNNPLKARQATVTVTIPAAVPSPSSSSYDWTAGAVNDYPIHFSCNATERRQLKRGLDEAVALAAHARDHIRRFGRDSPLYRRYFGNATTGEPIGWFDKIVSGDRGKVLFRCDDIDGNCRLDGWGGHWRGSNATTETVICPLSYTTRRPLEGLCGFGYTVSAGSLNFYFSSDLIHRLYHMPPVGEGVVEHYADTHAECLQLAKTSPEKAVRNTHSLQYFALDAYAYDLALPGVGCAGVQASGSATSSKATTTATATRSAATPPTTKPPVSTTSTLPPNCHTHDGGELHCV